MQTIPIEQAEGHLAVILRPLGTLRGSVLYIAPDFDEIPEGFEEYLPEDQLPVGVQDKTASE